MLEFWYDQKLIDTTLPFSVSEPDEPQKLYLHISAATIMQIITLLVGCAVLNTVVEPSWAITNGEHSAGFFCYLDSEGCGPSYWGAMCRLGRSQSPIHLTPTLLSSSAKTIVKLSVYKGESFRMVNNGHSVQVIRKKMSYLACY